MSNMTLGQLYLKELEAEAPASRKCLERVPESLFEYKPHEKSMKMGYLAVIVAEVPRWVKIMAEGGDINFANWKRFEPKTTADLVKYFDDNMADAKKVLAGASDQDMAKIFELKAGDKVLMSMPRKDFVGSSINHWVHHRGQLTVYLRLNNIPVPSIYGPSADESHF